MHGPESAQLDKRTGSKQMARADILHAVHSNMQVWSFHEHQMSM